MNPLNLTVHAVYGAIYHDGEFVQRGAVLGLSVDCKDVVIAPISGWIRVGSPEALSESLPESGLRIEIWQHRDDDEPGLPPTRN